MWVLPPLAAASPPVLLSTAAAPRCCTRRTAAGSGHAAPPLWPHSHSRPDRNLTLLQVNYLSKVALGGSVLVEAEARRARGRSGQSWVPVGYHPPALALLLGATRCRATPADWLLAGGAGGPADCDHRCAAQGRSLRGAGGAGVASQLAPGMRPALHDIITIDGAQLGWRRCWRRWPEPTHPSLCGARFAWQGTHVKYIAEGEPPMLELIEKSRNERAAALAAAAAGGPAAAGVAGQEGQQQQGAGGLSQQQHGSRQLPAGPLSKL